MEIPKQQILNLIESRMGSDQAAQASDQLPDQVDHEQHAGLLQQFGIDPQEAISQFGGGGGGQGGGFGGELGQQGGGVGGDPGQQGGGFGDDPDRY